MKWQSEKPIERGYCCPESTPESTGCTSVVRLHDQASSTSNMVHGSVYVLSSSERRAIEAYKLQVEEKRSRAIDTARRTTVL